MSEHSQHPVWHISSKNFEKCDCLNEDLGISWGGEELGWEGLSWQPGSKKRRNETLKSHVASEGLCMGTKASERTFALSLRHIFTAFWGLDTYLRYRSPSLWRVLVWGGKKVIREWLKQFLMCKTASNVFQITFSRRLVLAPCSSWTPACSLRPVLKWCLYILIQLLSDHISCRCCSAMICKRSIIYFYVLNRKYKNKVQSSANNVFYRTAFLRAGPLLYKWLFSQRVF